MPSAPPPPTSSEVSARLATINTSYEAKDKPTHYRALLESLLPCSTTPVAQRTLTQDLSSSLRLFLTHALDEQLGLVLSRQLAQDFVSFFGDWVSGQGYSGGGDADMMAVDADATAASTAPSNLPSDDVQSILRFALDKMQVRAVAFEEPISALRERLAALLQDEEEWSEAAKVLQGIPLDSGHRTISDIYRLKIYILIAQLLLEDEDSVAAETYLNRAALIVGKVTPESQPTEAQQTHAKTLATQFKASQARLLDYKRSFLQAASKYLDLSYNTDMLEEDRLHCLVEAVTAAVLAPAGPQRSRLLATLYKDDRVREQPKLQEGGLYSVLEKMFLDRVIRRNEVEEFAATLKPHQLAKLADGGTVLDRAVMEHNLLAASKIYNNISFKELGTLLGVDGEKAEQVASRMVTESRLAATIDQIDQLIFFVSPKVYPTWDHQISGLSHHVDSVVDMIQRKHPEWTAANVSSVTFPYSFIFIPDFKKVEGSHYLPTYLDSGLLINPSTASTTPIGHQINLGVVLPSKNDTGTMSASSLPVVLLRKATVSASTTPLKLIKADGTPTTELRDAQQVSLPIIQSTNDPQNQFQNYKTFAVTDPSGYKDYSLLTLIFFLEHQKLDQAAYLQRSLAYWSEVSKDVPSVSFIDRRDLMEYLTGVSESSVWLKRREEEIGVSGAPVTGGFGDRTGDDSGAGGDPMAIDGAKRAADDDLDNPEAKRMRMAMQEDWPAVKRIMARERSILTLQNYLSAKAASTFPLALKYSAEILRPGKQTSSSSSSKPGVPTSSSSARPGAVPSSSSRHSQPSSSSSSHAKPPSKPGAPTSSSSSSHKPSSSSHKPSSSSNGTSKGGSGSSSSTSNKKIPIIVVPAALSATITLFNIKQFIGADNPTYVPTETFVQRSEQKPPMVMIERKNVPTNIPRVYQVIDSVDRLRADDWSRIVAVFATGQEWQFKNWKIGSGSPVEIFSKVKGFCLKWSTDVANEKVKAWNVTVLSVSRERRHLDYQVAGEFWRELDTWIAKNRPGQFL
ncbi:hypothetical protein HDU76_012727 [Blyttiomyces sp. JEL0837]|nr:hypothetical protein HDU76_012727 [Blyttiomyces sp. JEL0837]